MIELAIKRRQADLANIDFKVCDATNYEMLTSLAPMHSIDKAVANMAIMDISEIEPLFKALAYLLKAKGEFVFATSHPAFTYPNQDYFTSCIDPGYAFEEQPVLHNYYHRSMSEIFNLAFKYNFIISGFEEVPFPEEKTPIIMIVRITKI